MDAIAKINWHDMHNMYTAMNWTWRGEGVPTAQQLRYTAEHLAFILASQNDSLCSTGMITVCISNSSANVFVGEYKSVSLPKLKK
jgi:hypothetical protein